MEEEIYGNSDRTDLLGDTMLPLPGKAPAAYHAVLIYAGLMLIGNLYYFFSRSGRYFNEAVPQIGWLAVTALILVLLIMKRKWGWKLMVISCIVSLMSQAIILFNLMPQMSKFKFIGWFSALITPLILIGVLFILFNKRLLTYLKIRQSDINTGIIAGIIAGAFFCLMFTLRIMKIFS